MSGLGKQENKDANQKLSRKEIQALKDKKQQEQVALERLVEAHHAVRTFPPPLASLSGAVPAA